MEEEPFGKQIRRLGQRLQFFLTLNIGYIEENKDD
jgi:hypothetical protein